MRNEFSHDLMRHADDETFVFITGDLGFGALEGLRDVLGERFINGGVAEQNMISAATGMARVGLRPWVYSIAPFVYARPFEQIRNGPCFHKLPVVAVGNGGGYAYGVMGATHHAIDDYGCLSTLPNISIFVPAFTEDLSTITDRLFTLEGPSYLRLGRDEKPKDFAIPEYKALRQIYSGNGQDIVVFCGPIVGEYITFMKDLPLVERPSLWLLSEFHSEKSILTDDFLRASSNSKNILVVEEHVASGGIGGRVSLELLKHRISPKNFRHLHAMGYPSGRYGSQDFHRHESGINAANIQKILNESRANEYE